MKHMRTTALLLLMGPALITSAQNENNNNDFQGTVGGGLGLSIPTGEFDRSWGKNMFQLGAHLGFPLGHIPVVQGGFAFGYSVMGSNDRTVPITTEYVGITEGMLTTRCKVFSYHPLLRLSPLRGRIRPYVDGMAGFRQFSTTSKVTADGVEENISKERNETDVAFSTGWAAGVMVTLGDVAYMELRVERFDSGEATYVDPESVTVSDQGTVSFNTLTSNTDATNVTIGIGLRF
jgi:hypothetical protein